MSTKKKGTAPFEQRIQDMFTTDPEKILAYITSRRRYASSLDPDIIVKINAKAQKMAENDFIAYLNTLQEREYTMLLQFQNILDNNDRVANLLRKKHTSEEEELFLMSWNTSNHAIYYALNHPDEETCPFDENDHL